MSLSQQIAPHLPYLRRYARALTGSQTSGDPYVVATLEAIIADPKSFPLELGPRVGLYRVFCSLWSPIAKQTDSGVDAIGEGSNKIMSNLASLTPMSRQAFLLKSVEGFSSDEVANILGVTPEKVTAYIEVTGREITEMVATDVLIIEDEALIATELSFITTDLGHRVIGIARTRDEARQLASKAKPGLVLADIQLADESSGIDAVNDILEVVDTPIIFITAFPERLLTGERPEPAFLISKPYDPEAVKATICQSLFFDHKASRKSA